MAVVIILRIVDMGVCASSHPRAGGRAGQGQACRCLATTPPTPPQPKRSKPEALLALARVDAPAGTLLLYWPGAWSIALAAPPGALPDPWETGAAQARLRHSAGHRRPDLNCTPPPWMTSPNLPRCHALTADGQPEGGGRQTPWGHEQQAA